MSRKRTTYSAEFKAKVVLEILEGEKTLNEIASKYKLLPKNLQNWKKQFLENASLAFDKSAVIKEYKEEIQSLKKQKDIMAKTLGEVTIERNWAVGNKKIVQLLLDNNATVDALSKDGETALMFAAQNKQKEIVQILLDNGANPNLQRNDGEFPLIFASKTEDKDTIQLLLDNGANPNLQRKDGVTVLMLASKYEQHDIVSLLLEHGANLNPKE